ncbi:hypothetical protein L1887_10965 [Cichorium endivia]|nr:hypothetical protein L1887_10965 [Cichorium endivia]
MVGASTCSPRALMALHTVNHGLKSMCYKFHHLCFSVSDFDSFVKTLKITNSDLVKINDQEHWEMADSGPGCSNGGSKPPDTLDFRYYEVFQFPRNHERDGSKEG